MRLEARKGISGRKQRSPEATHLTAHTQFLRTTGWVYSGGERRQGEDRGGRGKKVSDPLRIGLKWVLEGVPVLRLDIIGTLRQN